MNGVDVYNSLPTEVQMAVVAFGLIITIVCFIFLHKVTDGLPAGPMGW